MALIIEQHTYENWSAYKIRNDIPHPHDKDHTMAINIVTSSSSSAQMMIMSLNSSGPIYFQNQLLIKFNQRESYTFFSTNYLLISYRDVGTWECSVVWTYNHITFINKCCYFVLGENVSTRHTRNTLYTRSKIT